MPFCMHCGKEMAQHTMLCPYCGADRHYSERNIIQDRARYEGGYYKHDKKTKGILTLTDNRLTFRAKNFAFEIPAERLESVEKIEGKKISKKKAVTGVALAPLTAGISLALTARRDEIGKIVVGFTDEQGETYTPVFDVGKRYEEWKNKIDNLIEATKEGQVDRVMETPRCLVKNLQEGKYGKILLKTTQGRYYGGHKAHLAGGLFSKEEVGLMYLTEEFLIFCKSKSWAIKVPLKKVIIPGWTIREESRRKTFGGGGFGGWYGPTFMGTYGGILHESGKRHEIVLPYVDENGIPQEPRFAIGSLTGGAVKNWAKAIYERIVEIRKEGMRINEEAKPSSKSEEDPLKILKIRYARGEITKEEYEEMRKTLES